MATTALLLDWRPAYLVSDQVATSLLRCPLGASTVFEHLRERVFAAEVDALGVLPSFACDEAYRAAMQELDPGTIVVAPAAFGKFLDLQEPCDRLLLVDARYFPIGGFEFRALVSEVCDYQLARHLTHWGGRNGDTLHERILCDEQQRVRTIQRLYDRVTHCGTQGVSCTLISVATAWHLRSSDLGSLSRLRARLVGCGIPSRDIAAASPALDLRQSEDLLALNAQVTLAATGGRLQPPFTELAPGVWIGPGCNIHPTSRIYAPVILHANVSVGAEAVVAGPAVVGTEASVGPGAIVSQSLLAAGARVTAGTAVARRVLIGASDVASSDEERGSDGPVQPFFSTSRWAQDGSSEMQSRHSARKRRLAAAVKRALDFLLALLGLVLLSPLLLLVAALVKFTSHGPVFFGHEREGRNGKLFRCWKFRTMVDHAHAMQRTLYRQNLVDGPQFKLPDDPRTTWLGRWLRKTNIDELAQLYNVLRGEMSLIGPRPSPFRENQICVPWRNARLSARPGITGLWQVCRRERSGGDFHQWIYFDMLYVRHWSLGLDLRILLATLLTLGGRWSVPLAWMIPGHERQAEARSFEFPGCAWPVLTKPRTRGNARVPAAPLDTLTPGARSPVDETLLAS